MKSIYFYKKIGGINLWIIQNAVTEETVIVDYLIVSAPKK